MRPLYYCLGISIEQGKDQKCIWVHQKQYILKMLEKYGFADSKVVSTPADVNNELNKDDGVSKAVDPNKYQSMVGSLLYAQGRTRKNIDGRAPEVGVSVY